MKTRIKKQYGFSLIELMVSVTIAMFLLLMLSDFFISIFKSSKISEAKMNNEKEIEFILGKIKNSLKWTGYVPAETLGDTTAGESLLSDIAFDDPEAIFPMSNLNGCNFSAGSSITISTDNKTLCIRNYLPPTSNSSIYNDVNNGKPNWTSNSSKAEIQGILSCSGYFYFSSIFNSFEKEVMLITKITANPNGQLTCNSFIESNPSDIKSYTADSEVFIDSLNFTSTKNSVSLSLTVSSGKEVLQQSCSYPNPLNTLEKLSTNSKKLCTTINKTFGLIK